jgi:hypothetical protein
MSEVDRELQHALAIWIATRNAKRWHRFSIGSVPLLLVEFPRRCRACKPNLFQTPRRGLDLQRAQQGSAHTEALPLGSHVAQPYVTALVNEPDSADLSSIVANNHEVRGFEKPPLKLFHRLVAQPLRQSRGIVLMVLDTQIRDRVTQSIDRSRRVANAGRAHSEGGTSVVHGTHSPTRRAAYTGLQRGPRPSCVDKGIAAIMSGCSASSCSRAECDSMVSSFCAPIPHRG